ncbi:MAG: class I SAM-dependent methyltransferase family protein [Nanoarchaeota archaeon]
MSGYDILGNIVLVKFERGAKLGEKKKWALKFLKSHGNIETILEKSGKVSGRLRTPKSKWIAGVKTKEVLYRENGCSFRFNVDSCYFSPRLSSERAELAGFVKKGERLLVMFGGVGVFAIVIAKARKAREIVGVELGKIPSKYAQDNVKRNKVNVACLQGDVRRVIPKLEGEFDRIVMARPNLKDSFLDVAFAKVKHGGVIHYYGFYAQEDVEEMKELIMSEARKAGMRVKIKKIKKAGDIGVKKYRYRADIAIL